MGGSQSVFNHEDALLKDNKTTYSHELTGPEHIESGSTKPLHNNDVKDKPCRGGVIDKDGSEINTLWGAFLLGYKNFPNNEFLGTRKYTVASASEGSDKAETKSGYVERKDGTILRGEYVWDTYSEIYEAATALGRGIASFGSKKGDNVGIFAINRSEWIISALAFYSQSLRTVSLYATLGPDAVEYIVNHAETQVVIVSKENFTKLKKSVEKIKDTVKHIIVIDCILDGKYGNILDKVNDKDVVEFASQGIELHGMSDIIALGKTDEMKEKYPIIPPEADELAYIMYTSGTTGVPKGAMLSHRNIMSPISCVPDLVKFDDKDVHFSYLPLAHIFETVIQAVAWCYGARIAFSQGDIRRLVEDLQTARPTIFPGVPRVFVKFYQNIWANVEAKGRIANWYIRRAYRYQCDRLNRGQPLDKSYDKKIFRLMREKVGLDRVKILISGAAPCPSYLVEFMRVMTNSFFAQGYGLTESSAGSCVQYPTDKHCGEVGPPLSCNDIKLVDVPDLNYFSTDNPPRGEVWISGPNIFKGYFKNEESTKEALVTDSHGRVWLCTGDVGRFNPNGTLSIIDRKKNMIKLAQGEYVAVEKVEDVYGKAPCVSQIWCYGNSYKSTMIGVVVPNVQPVYDFAMSKGLWNKAVPAPIPGSLTPEFIEEFKRVIYGPGAADIKAWIKSQLDAVESELLGFEKMKDFYVEGVLDSLGQGFSEENGLLTPTMKKKRKPLSEYYLPQLKKLYVGIGEPEQAGEKW